MDIGDVIVHVVDKRNESTVMSAVMVTDGGWWYEVNC